MKLNQVIAIEKGIKTKVQSDVDAIYKAAQKPSLFDGFVKTYKKKAEDDEDVPSQRQHVQLNAVGALARIAQLWSALFDVTAQKDFANCDAKADVVVDGEVLLKQAPATYLLFLEKQLTDLYTIVSKFPTLDPAERWEKDLTTAGLYRTEAVPTTRTKKVQKAIVLYPHSAEHPAQTQLITEDVSVGTWELVKFSAALPDNTQRAILSRIQALQVAVKAARQEANTVAAPETMAGFHVFDWVFKDLRG